MQGYDSLDDVKEKGLAPLDVDSFKKNMTEDVLVLDTRHASVFTKGFIPGSIFIGLEGRFAEWAGSLLSFDKSILLVTEAGKEEETVVRLSLLDELQNILPVQIQALRLHVRPEPAVLMRALVIMNPCPIEGFDEVLHGTFDLA